MSDRSTFSPFWHRVRVMKPRLRPHVQITRQHFRGKRWHVVHDPSSNQFYRLNPVAHEFVGLLDGRREVEEVWRHGLTRHGDEALTQNEVIQLLSQLFGSNLLSADVPPETEQLLSRGRERLGKRVRQQAIGLMYFKIRLFNPDRILSWVEPILRPLIGRVGLILWSLWVLAGLTALLPHWQELVTGFGSAIAPSNWGWMIAVFIATKLFHELGHGVICKRFGGQVPEFGAMMLVMLPAPYVDASSAWGFTSKWRRAAVGAGGMIFELTLAAGAAFLWINTDRGELLHQLAYNVIFTSSVSTVLFNANPLMRFDGYYIFSDLIEVPNLMQRSTAMLKFLFFRHVYRIKNAVPPTGNAAEAGILVVYGVVAMAYRLFLFFSITLYVMGQMFAIGLFLAVWTASMWFLLPVGGFIHWLATGPNLAEKRARAIATSLALVAVVVLLVGIIRVPDRRRAVGVVESVTQSGVYFGVEGFVKVAHVRPGQRVEKGEPILTLESDRLQAHRALGRAQLLEAEAMARQAVGQSNAGAQVAQEYVKTLHEQIRLVEDRISKLVVRAPHAGVVVGADPHALVGAYVQAGQPACIVSDDKALRVTAVLTQREASWLRDEDVGVEFRVLSRVEHAVPGVKDRVLEAGTHELPHEALGAAGGGTIPTEQEESGRLTTDNVFKGYFFAVQDDGAARPGAIGGGGKPGERVALRFTLASKPLMAQWYDRLQKSLQGRAKV